MSRLKKLLKDFRSHTKLDHQMKVVALARTSRGVRLLTALLSLFTYIALFGFIGYLTLGWAGMPMGIYAAALWEVLRWNRLMRQVAHAQEQLAEMDQLNHMYWAEPYDRERSDDD